MGKDKKEKARRSSEEFKTADAKAKTTSKSKGASTTTPVNACPLRRWKLTLKVTAQVNERKKTLKNANVTVVWDDLSRDSKPCTMSAKDKGQAAPIEGNDIRGGKCKASSKGWRLAHKSKPVNLSPGDDKTVELTLKPARWIAFHVVNETTNKPIKGIKVNAELPGPGAKRGTTKSKKAVYFEKKVTKGQAKITSYTHDTVLWEAVGDITSA